MRDDTPWWPAQGRAAQAGLAAVRVQAAGRLHLGFLDPAGSLGRRFGSLGLVVEGFETVIEMRRAATDEVTAGACVDRDAIERAARHLHALRRATGRSGALHVHLQRTLPAHAGLGSGTQLALAVGHAFAALAGLPLTTGDVARLTGRGLRSGVGIAGYDLGGLLLDGGPGDDGRPAPLLSRLPLPAPWRIVLALEPGRQGLSGEQEKSALAALPPLPRAAAAELCHQVLMRVLPSAAAGAFEPFAAGITRMQQVLGEHFAPAQGGSAFASGAVRRLIEWLGGHAQAAIGQSSWGPTGFAIFASADDARDALAAARAAGVVDPALELHVVRARNHGATLTPL
ncbi:beta-ribofuranosylaminobenzene 5'-phosphate synthase [Calidifontimicrobium sp. SYSU G02091]|uniref:beta-ribofuranosylaminobenzene 5'-phosphate synthase family protein n=1 Tax=Calidifontimicrobium sp. SYSU G02091 TaxID=2926421 RepID=UPI001F5337C3|nr:beta-ribofuranosylaminobenzene 5'-phosphate synthase family protein [Calidifontimicrobium sp. SYSU G02091]MCI1192560.1 beta-ribofuranosylaminobenzene 5'-phosphate synthase [Calidifontimicrobium sp. SYSU G02091]